MKQRKLRTNLKEMSTIQLIPVFIFSLLLSHLFDDNYDLWIPKTKRVEVRGQYANSFDELK